MPSKKRKRYGLYTAGELNRLIDSIVHPHYRQNESLRLLDAVLHGLVEQNPPETLKKFLHYNVSEVMKKTLKKRVKRAP